MEGIEFLRFVLNSIINILEIFSGKLDDQTNYYVRIMADSTRVVCNVNYIEVFKHEVWQKLFRIRQ